MKLWKASFAGALIPGGTDCQHKTPTSVGIAAVVGEAKAIAEDACIYG